MLDVSTVELAIDYFQADEDEFEEITIENDPTLSIYDLDVMEDIVQKYFGNGWKFETLKHKYKKLSTVKQIHRYINYIFVAKNLCNNCIYFQNERVRGSWGHQISKVPPNK